jgi:hypothetical protein
MASYYKYQNPSEIGAAPTLDWGTVISNVNQNLQAQEQQRYENREADKKLTNNILTKANEITANSDPNFGAILQKTADQMKSNTFIRYNLLKQGKISRSDYNIFNQNASSSIAQLDSFSKNWDKIYTTALDLRKKGLTTDLSNALQDALGGFANFTDKKLVQGNDGFLNTATIDPATGKVLDNSLGILPMQTLNNVKNFTDLRINLQDAANKYAKDIKPFIISERTGKVLTREDILKRPGYTDFLDNAFNGIAVNDNVIADILTTYGDYKTDLNLKDSDNASKKITAKQSNGAFVSDITPEMRKEAKEIFEKQLLYQVKSEETPMPVFSPNTGGGAGTTKTPKPQDIPSVGKVVPMYGQKTNKLQGPAFSVSNIRINRGPGIMREIGGVALRDGQLVITGYDIEGKETASSETDYGKGGFTVTKKTKFMSNPIIKGKRTKAEGLWSDVNGSVMEDIITRIPIPGGQGEKFSSVAQAKEFLEQEQQGMSPTRPVKNTEYTNITETNKGTIGVKNGKWYDIKTGKPI